MPADTPYLEIEDKHFGDGAYALGWKPAASGLEGLTLKGECPICHDSGGIDEYVPTSNMDAADSVLVRCCCNVQHAPGKKGCGRYAAVKVP